MVFSDDIRRGVVAIEQTSRDERERYIALGFIKPGKLGAAELSRRGYYDASAAQSRRLRKPEGYNAQV